MLDKACVTAIQAQLQTIAMGYVATWMDNSPAPSNLTAGSLPRVCSDIRDGLTGNGAVPTECAKFVGPEMSWYDGSYSNMTFTVSSLTGPNSTTDETCTFNTSSSSPSFALPSSNLSLITQEESSLDSTNKTLHNTVYDEAVTLVYPIFTVLFPPANDSNRASGTVSEAEAFLTCARPVNVTAGSRTAAALPAPNPLRKIVHPLSAGVKAGIAVGVVLGVLLIGGAVAWLCISRKRKRRTVENERNLDLIEQKMRSEREGVMEAKTPMLGGEERVEIEGDLESRDKRTPMLDGNERYEAPGVVGHELHGGNFLVELEGSGVQR